MCETTISASEEVRAAMEAMIEQAGGHEALAERRRQYTELFRQLMREEKSLRERYPDQFVAIAPGDVLVAGDSLDEVIRSLREKGVPPGKAVIEFLDTSSEPLVV